MVRRSSSTGAPISLEFLSVGVTSPGPRPQSTNEIPDMERTVVSELKIGIILGSTRPGRNGKAVADWVLDKAQARIGADYHFIDPAAPPFPHWGEPMSPMLGQYAGEHTKAWAATIARYDGY